jgi:uncharacterized Rmd1/YagE family protein
MRFSGAENSSRRRLLASGLGHDEDTYGSVDDVKSSTNPMLLSRQLSDSSLQPEIQMGRLGIFDDEKKFLPIIKTGRQRKKIAARKADFRIKPKKRVYFCCLTSSVIDVENLHEQITATTSSAEWKCTMFQEVLHIWIPGQDSIEIEKIQEDIEASGSGWEIGTNNQYEQYESGPTDSPSCRSAADSSGSQRNQPTKKTEDGDHTSRIGSKGATDEQEESDENNKTTEQLWSSNSKECFVFGFGSVVLWGFENIEEEVKMIDTFRRFAVKQVLDDEEFGESEDDMAFTLKIPFERSISSNDKHDEKLYGIHVENDVLDIPSAASTRQRLSISFALAQSSILSVFEARIQKLVEEYRYIPETLSSSGRVRLSALQLGNMIGDVFVIRHDVNLNSEILDTPDWFWNERDVEALYKFLSAYMEMNGRAEILNKRLDMLKQLLDMLQAQHENAHSVKLEWIVIILIVISVVIELITLAVHVLSK